MNDTSPIVNREPVAVRCERCGTDCITQTAGVALCPSCVVLIVKEWRVHREEFAELSTS